MNDLRGEIEGLEPRAAAKALRRALVERVQSFLGSACPPGLINDPANADKTFIEWGFDSLRSVDFKEELERALQCELSATLLIDAPTPAALANALGRDVLGWSLGDSGAGAGRESGDLGNRGDSAASSAPVYPLGGRGVVGGEAGGETASAPSTEDPQTLARKLNRAQSRLERAEARLAELERDHQRRAEPIAIVGVGCRFPGGVSDRGSLGELLADGRDGVGEIPVDRFDAQALLDPRHDVPGKLISARGGFLPDLDKFDARFFGVSGPEALELDPQQRLLLEEAWRCLEDAGVPPERWRGRRIGVFLGGRGSEYFDAHTDRRPIDAGPYYATGNALSTCAGRLSFTFGWTGPSFALDTACSSSLVALHQAVRSLRAGECEHALAGGVNLILDPVSSVSVSRAGMLSPRGRCASFSDQADGYVRAEGCGLVALTPYSRALEQGLRPLALIRGTAINSDGRSGGLTVPNGRAQESVLRAALDDGGVSPAQVQFVAAHGTGTELGDPIELRALDAVYGGNPSSLWVGALKTQIGHGESSAGIAGLLQVLVSMRDRRLPGLLHFKAPNPHVDWPQLGLEICAEPRDWPSPNTGARMGAVSSFGFSGTNAHVVLSESPDPTPEALTLGQDPALLALSAHTPAALAELARAYIERLDARGELRDLAEAAGHHRAQLGVRAAVVLEPDCEAQRVALQEVQSGQHAPARAADTPGVALLFGGQGSQQVGAGRELAQHAPVFRRALERCAQAIDSELDRPLLELLFEAEAEQLAETQNTQPVVYALQVAQAEWLATLGVTPAVALGHSVGELAAACVAGVFDMESGARLAARRGRILADRVGPGAMLAVGLEEDEAQRWAERFGLSIAALNARGAVTLSGEFEAIDAASSALREAGLAPLRLATTRAFHSPAVDAAAEDLRGAFADIQLHPPQIPLVSGRTGQAERELWCDPDHWVRSMREPVRFSSGLDALASLGGELGLELGGRSVTTPLAARHLGSDWPAYSLLQRHQSEPRASLAALGRLWEHGVPVDLRRVGRDGPWEALPGAPFERERHWYTKRGAHDLGQRRHPLLHGERQVAGDPLDTHRLQGRLWSDDPAWIAEHRVHDLVLFPGSGFVECALVGLQASAASQAPLGLGSLSLRAPLAVDERGIELECLTRQVDGHMRLELFARNGNQGPLQLHATAAPLDGNTHTEVLDVSVGAGWESCEIEAFRDNLASRGLNYGPRFCGLTELSTDGTAAQGLASLPAEHDAGDYLLHPALLDACFQACGAVLFATGGPTYLPVALDRLELLAPGSAHARVHLTRREHSGRSAIFDLDLVDPQSAEPIAHLRGLRLAPAEPERLRQALERDERLLHIEVSAPVESTACEDLGQWQVLACKSDPRLPALVSTGARIVHDLDRLDPAAGPTLWLAPLSIGDDPSELERLGLLEQARRAHARGIDAWALTGARARFAGDGQLHVDHAALLGFARSLRREAPQNAPRWIDLDPGGDPHWVQGLSEALALTAEPELARRSGVLLAPRLGSRERASEWGELQTTTSKVESSEDAAGALALDNYGSFEHLVWSQRTRSAPAPGEIEVAVDVAALNFKDTLYALGLLPDLADPDPAQQALGFEGVGLVVRSSASDGPRPGERVVVSAPGCLATHIRLPANAARPVHPDLDHLPSHALVAARTTGVTAIHALVEHADLKAGECVLIHAGAGGVGQVAVSLARALGARVFATSSSAKRENVLAAGAEAVFDSRTTEFSQQVLEATKGRGVDVVLNSLRDEFVGASFDCLASGGRFIEIGRLGTWEPEYAQAQRPDAKYVRFDLEQTFARDYAAFERLAQALEQHQAQGLLRAPQVSMAPVGAARTAFARLAGARLTGKQVLALPPRPEPLTLSGEGTLLVTGATGAVGPALAAELVGRGARSVLAVARNAPDAAAQERLDALIALGAQVEFRRCDVSQRSELESLVSDRRGQGQPITAVLHAAGRLGDGLLEGLEPTEFADRAQQVMGAKLDGALALDELLPNLELFALASSITAWLGNAGQTLYGAANAALDAIAERRRARGQRAVSVAFGPWADQGMAARLGTAEHARLARYGWRLLAPARARKLFAAALDEGRAQLAAFDAELERYVESSGHAEPYLSALTSSQRSLRTPRFDAQAWLSLDVDQRRSALLDSLSKEVAHVLGGRPEALETRAGFADLGLDSLLAVDLKGRLEGVYAIELPGTVAFDAPNLEALADLLGERLVAATPEPGTAAVEQGNKEPNASTTEGEGDSLAAQLAAELERLEGERGR